MFCNALEVIYKKAVQKVHQIKHFALTWFRGVL